MVFLAPVIVRILAGSMYSSSIPLLQILVFMIFAVGVNNILGIQGLVSFGYKDKFTRILLTAGLIHLLLLTVLSLVLSATGAAIAVVITELIVCILMYKSMKNLKVL